MTVPLTKLKLYLFLHLFRMATMLECFLYFQIAFKVRLDFSCSLDRVHHLTNLKYQDFKLYWKRDYLKPPQFQDQFEQVCYSQLN